MRYLKFLAVPLLALSLAGCAGGASILAGGSSITATVKNPASNQELATIYRTYLIAGKTYVRYRDLGICPAGVSFTVSKPCADRATLVYLQDKDRKAYAAITAARNFIRNNPDVSALSLIGAARSAVTDFQNSVNAGVK